MSYVLHLVFSYIYIKFYYVPETIFHVFIRIFHSIDIIWLNDNSSVLWTLSVVLVPLRNDITNHMMRHMDERISNHNSVSCGQSTV